MDYQQFDKKHLWHPFTQALNQEDPLCIVKGKGANLFDQDEKAYLDLVSSWWVTCHGHAHPKIARAIYKQALELEQVIFAGFTHPPALNLVSKLKKHLPSELSRFFFSDNGSTAVEVALKMAYQYFFNQNQKEKTIFLHFQGGYHGDTYGAMAVGRTSGFYKPFENFLFKTVSISYPETWDGDQNIEEKEMLALMQLEETLKTHKGKIVAMILEPLIQGASGMKMARASFIKTVCKKLKDEGILVIFDEVMTAFYRTGSFFAFEEVGIVPDFLCLSKALSGGFLPLSLTVTNETIFEAFKSEKMIHTFLHGHSFTANPLGCAAAIASLELFENPKVKQKIKSIEKEHKKGLEILNKTGLIEKSFAKGTIARFELKDKNPELLKQIRIHAEKEGLIIRPLKGVIYLLPPYIISLVDLKKAYLSLEEIILRSFVKQDSLLTRPLGN